MPRDLHAIAQEAVQGFPELTKSPEAVEKEKNPPKMDEDRSSSMDATDEDDAIERYRAAAGSTSKRDELHPYTQSLSPKDVESCTRLEAETFPPHERCTREKVSLPCLFFLFCSITPLAALESSCYTFYCMRCLFHSLVQLVIWLSDRHER